MREGDYNSVVEIMIKLAINNNEFCDLAIFDRLIADPDISQAALAEALGVAIGTVNRRLQEMVEKGYVQVERTRRRKLRYKVTPAGHTLHQTLTHAYIEQSFKLYRQVRQQVKSVLKMLKDADVHTVRLSGEGDLADICRLTCLEQNVTITENLDAPVLVINGLEIRVESLEN
jgi:DNA-binding MarR family transcriptional regulator